MIDSILLVPADGDPHGLLADGPCFSFPPAMWRTAPHGVWAPYQRPAFATSVPVGLVLAHGNRPVPEGCDRLCRVIGDRPLFEYSIASVRLRADVYVQANRSARLVLLDADGRDVTP